MSTASQMISRFQALEIRDEHTKITIVCTSCGKKFVIEMPTSKFGEWIYEGKHIQDVFPDFTDEQRELLISQTCETCFDRMFSDEGEEF